ncbi:MAG: hypothetical protein R2941_14160 [Desulfobacterales bacterium]
MISLQNYPMNADVHCTDGRFGRSTHIILNPATANVTHVVVKDKETPNSERLLPTRWIKDKTPELILVSRTKAEVRTLELFRQTDFVRREFRQYSGDPRVILLWPYVIPAKKIFFEEIGPVPPKELAIRRGAPVKAADGRIGQVDEFLVCPDTCHVTHLVLREGLPWDRKLITIPISEIDRVEQKSVYLKLNKQEVRALPAIPVRQKELKL